jgi:hypothetical protein
MKILYILNSTMFDYNKKSIVILGSVIIGCVISYGVYQKKTHKKYYKKPVIKKQLIDDEVINLSNANVKVNHTKPPIIQKPYQPIRFSLQQTKKFIPQIVLPQIVLPQIMVENEIHAPNKVKHDTILKFLVDINNANIDLRVCDTKHDDASLDDDNPIIIMARS